MAVVTQSNPRLRKKRSGIEPRARPSRWLFEVEGGHGRRTLWTRWRIEDTRPSIVDPSSASSTPPTGLTGPLRKKIVPCNNRTRIGRARSRRPGRPTTLTSGRTDPIQCIEILLLGHSGREKRHRPCQRGDIVFPIVDMIGDVSLKTIGLAANPSTCRILHMEYKINVETVENQRKQNTTMVLLMAT